MQNKKKLYKHLLIIYVIYFAALVFGFVMGFVPNFTSGFSSAQQTLAEDYGKGSTRTYYVYAQLEPFDETKIDIPGLPDNITPSIDRINMRIAVDGIYTMDNAFRVVANNGYAYLIMFVSLLAYVAIFILIALIINSLRRSIRNETPLSQSNITLTRVIGGLILLAEVCDAVGKHINQQEALRLLADTTMHVDTTFPLNYWNVIVGILFLFMAEVFSIGTQLSEEQKFTI